MFYLLSSSLVKLGTSTLEFEEVCRAGNRKGSLFNGFQPWKSTIHNANTLSAKRITHCTASSLAMPNGCSFPKKASTFLFLTLETMVSENSPIKERFNVVLSRFNVVCKLICSCGASYMYKLTCSCGASFTKPV